jgi:hypothetical protein
LSGPVTRSPAPASGIIWLDAPESDDYGRMTIGHWGGWAVDLISMIFNDRLCLTPERALSSYDYGWCYPKGGAVLAAALAWNPASQGEPVGYLKAAVRATGHAREPGEVCQ